MLCALKTDNKALEDRERNDNSEGVTLESSDVQYSVIINRLMERERLVET